MRRNRIGMTGGRTLTFKDETVGPSHDPYARQTVELRRGKLVIWRLVSCGLAGEWLEDMFGRKIELREPMFLGQEAKRAAHDEWEREVEKITGQSSDFWMSTVWEKRDRAFWRSMTREEQYQYQEWMQAEAEMLRYAR
jgi:hypothetical protein